MNFSHNCFFNVFLFTNQNFGWYKLPTPPLRTLSTVRPGQGESPNKEQSFDCNMHLVGEDGNCSDNKDWYSEYILESPLTERKHKVKDVRKIVLNQLMRHKWEARRGSIS